MIAIYYTFVWYFTNCIWIYICIASYTGIWLYTPDSVSLHCTHSLAKILSFCTSNAVMSKTWCVLSASVLYVIACSISWTDKKVLITLESKPESVSLNNFQHQLIEPFRICWSQAKFIINFNCINYNYFFFLTLNRFRLCEQH